MSMETMLLPMLGVGTIFGTMPLKRQKSNGNKLTPSPIKMAFTIFFVAVSIYNLAYTQDMVTLKKKHFNCETQLNCTINESSATTGLIVIQSINPEMLIFMSLTAHWVSFFQVRLRLPTLISRLDFVDRKLSHLLPEELRQIKYYRSIAKYVLFLALSTPVFTFYIAVNTGKTFPIVLWIVGLVFHNLVSFSCELQLLTFLEFLRSQFKIINDELRAAAVGASIRLKIVNLRKTDSLNLQAPLSLGRVNMMHDCYTKLCDSWLLLNDIYSTQVVLSMSGCFIKALFNTYTVMSGSSLDGREKSNIERSVSVMWAIFYSSRFALLAISASMAANEANKTKANIAILNVRQYNEDIREELEMFWMDAFTRHLNFATCLFHLNSRLIIKACNTGITYLVLLVQFKPQMNIS